jgi:selenium metabolism protein YedF
VIPLQFRFSNVAISGYIWPLISDTMKTVDTKGLRCPAPLIKTRQALNDVSEGESLKIIIDNPSSLNNIKRFLTDNHLQFTEKEEPDAWILTVDRGEETTVSDNAENYCSSSPDSRKKNTVVAITSDTMGGGDEELGHKLIISFFKVLPLIQPLPSSIVFYNTGVKLVVRNSPVEEYIKELESRGVKLYLCTTCVDFYSLKDNLVTGNISDMYQILNILNEADNIIRP